MQILTHENPIQGTKITHSVVEKRMINHTNAPPVEM